MSARKLLITLLTVATLGFSALGMVACGENGGGITSEPPATHAHDWNEYVSKQATCDEKGEVLYSCYCGEKYTVATSALGHKVKSIQAKAPTCTEIGWNAYEICERDGCAYTTYEEIKENGHDFQKGVCVVDGCGVKEPPENHTKHEWDEGQITTTPTCTEKGIKTFTCWCTEKYTETVDELGHDKEMHDKQDATCTEIGWEAYETCKRAGCDYTTYVEIAINPNNHKYENDVCVDCGKKDVSKGLAYTLSDDSTYYIVTGIGTCTDTDIVIPDTYEGLPVASIGDEAFSQCYSLTSVTIPDSVTSIGDGGFYYCRNLTSVTIGNSVTSIGDDAFGFCDSLTNIEVNENNVNYSSLDGNLYKKDQTKLIQYAIGKTATSFTIPDSVTSIGDNAFASCYSLTSVTIPDSVTSIGAWAFYECSSLTSVTIPDSVTSIGDSAFLGCGSLTSVTIGNSVTSIGRSAFWGCDSLTSVTIGDSVTSIGSRAFAACNSLTNIEVDENNAYYSSLDGNLYNKNKTELIQYAIGKTATSFAIPDSVTSIGAWAFAYCTNLTSVTILDSVTSIGDSAFLGCGSLTSVAIGNSVTSIGEEAFSYCDGLTSIAFNGTVAEWKAISKGYYWKDNIPATEVVCTDGTVSYI